MIITDEIYQRLSKLKPSSIRLEDESSLHAGHPGSLNGGHYRLYISSPLFNGLPILERHRLIYDLLKDLMKDKIHALSIDAQAN
ncbi:MAG: BolA family transcriptional regulator [Proteobacteria bacterium]|nr:BolA family transcriptional regulator [Pseudomonadota bacterium]